MKYLTTRAIETLSKQKAEQAIVADRKAYSGSDLLSMVTSRQAQLSDLPEGSVIMLAEAGVVFWTDLIAVWGAGMTAVHFDVTADAATIAEMYDIVEPTAILKSTDRKIAGLQDVPTFSFADAEVLPSIATPKVIDSPTNIASIIFTSGSTGRIKGVALSSDALLGNSLGILEVLPLTSDDRLFVPIAFNFMSALNHFIACMVTGATLLCFERRLLLGDFLDAINDSKATCLGGSPLHVRWIAEAVSEKSAALNWVMSSGDALLTSTIDQFQEAFPNVGIYCVYGLTEVGGRFCILPFSKLSEKKGSVGKPIKGLHVTVRDEEENEVGPGVLGEICASGDFLMEGYYQAADLTEETIGPYGMRTRDSGYLDEEGFLYVVGRLDDTFKTNGKKVSAVLISDVLLSLGMFTDVAIGPGNDPILGSVPWLFYVLKPDAEFQKGVALRAVRSKLPSNHLPQKFIEVDEIPRTGSGKLKRAVLRRMIADLSA